MMTSLPRPLLVLVGPTAVGKTALSLALAIRFNGEIISADSRLFYRGLDIGTAKPTASERSLVPHHLIDVCAPDETLSLGAYQDLAFQAIEDCHRRSRLPILVGGTGQYIMAIVEGWGIPRIPPRQRLRAILATFSGEELGRWLAALDPGAAGKIDPRNVRRVIRALEVTLTAGRPISEIQRKKAPPYRQLIVGLDRDRLSLYRRIDERVDQMVADGLVEEVRTLLAAGLDWHLPALSGLGYRQLQPFLDGDQSLEEAVERIKFDTHRFARQQYTWFRRDDPRIQWLAAGDPAVRTRAETLVARWLADGVESPA